MLQELRARSQSYRAPAIAQFQIGLRVVRHFGDFLPSKLPDRRCFSRASFAVRGKSQMMDDKRGRPKLRPAVPMLGPTLSWTLPDKESRGSRSKSRTFSCST